MTYDLQNVAQYAIAIFASVFPNLYQYAINATAYFAFAAQNIAATLVAIFVIALLADAILEEDAIHLVIMFAIIHAK